MGKFIWHQWAQFVNIFASVCACPPSLPPSLSPVLTPSGSFVFADRQMSSGLASGPVSSPNFSGTLSEAQTSQRPWPSPLADPPAASVPTPCPVVPCKCFALFIPLLRLLCTDSAPQRALDGAMPRCHWSKNTEIDTTLLLPLQTCRWRCNLHKPHRQGPRHPDPRHALCCHPPDHRASPFRPENGNLSVPPAQSSHFTPANLPCRTLPPGSCLAPIQSGTLFHRVLFLLLA